MCVCPVMEWWPFEGVFLPAGTMTVDHSTKRKRAAFARLLLEDCLSVCICSLSGAAAPPFPSLL